MAEKFRVLGQSSPVTGVLTDLYTVPASNDAIVSSLIVCNRGGAIQTVRVAICPGGANIANEHYLYYEVPLGGNATLSLTAGITLEDGDIVRVRASSGDVSFHAYGSEIS